MVKENAVAYTRVSTKSDAQIHSYEYQNEYWKNIISEDPKYAFCGIYADQGISGRGIAKRPQFLKMMQDAENGKFNVIYTKSVARFGRNTEELLTSVRRLRDIGIRVIFEKEQIDTMATNSELFLTVAAAVAENDLRIYSDNQKWAIRDKFAKGFISIGTRILGYRMNTDTNTLEVQESEAVTVKEIFAMYLGGKGIMAIVKELTEKKRQNAFGVVKWDKGSIHYILHNEKYKGCSLAQKTVTHMGVCKPNKGEATQYYIEDTHEGIISKEDFDRVKEVMRERATPSLIGAPKPTYPFSHLITCGVCGHGYSHRIQNPNKPYSSEIWLCHYADAYGKAACDNTRIKDSVLKEKFVECYNEFILNRQENDAQDTLRIRLDELIKQEQELNAMRVNKLIALEDYKSEFGKLKTEIEHVKNEINKYKVRSLSKSDYEPIAEFKEEKVDKFLDKVTIHRKVVTFTFINGVRLSRAYDNGKGGNKIGWLDRKKEKEEQ